MVLFLLIAPGLLSLTYAWTEHLGVWDRLTGRKKAVQGLRRLQSSAGYPESCLFDDEADASVYSEIERRIRKRTTNVELLAVLARGEKPTLIGVVGSPIAINGVPPDWPQSCRFYASAAHPIVFGFGARVAGPPGVAHRACAVGEVERWLTEEKERRRFYVGSAVVGLLSLALVVLRYASTPVPEAALTPALHPPVAVDGSP